jgi:signal peptidase II
LKRSFGKFDLTLAQLGGVIGVSIFVVDRVSKWWILNVVDLPTHRQIEVLPFFDLSMVWNQGVSFGLFQSDSLAGRTILVLFSLGVVGFLIKWLLEADRRLQAIFLGMIIGGALGNAADRMIYGAVVDFLDFSGLGFKWVFNVADSAISGGVALLVFDSFFAKEDPEDKSPSA